MTHTCKLHNHEHEYARCIECGHEYCSHYWLSCPQCNGAGNGNLTSRAKDENAAFRKRTV